MTQAWLGSKIACMKSQDIQRALRVTAVLILAGLQAGVAQAAASTTTSSAPMRGAVTTASGKQASADQVREAAQFWRDFRQALLKGNGQQLERMTRLPLVVKGVTDDQAPRRVGKGKLTATLNTLLGQEIYPAHAVTDRAQPLRHIVENTPELQPRHWSSPQQVRVESLAFAKDKSGWKLVTVYDEAQ